MEKEELEKNVQLTKKLESIYQHKKISIKSILRSDNKETASLDEESTIYCKMDVEDAEYGPDFLYFYGRGKDRLIVRLDDLQGLDFDDFNEDSEMEIQKKIGNQLLEIRIKIVK